MIAIPNDILNTILIEQEREQAEDQARLEEQQREKEAYITKGQELLLSWQAEMLETVAPAIRQYYAYPYDVETEEKLEDFLWRWGRNPHVRQTLESVFLVPGLAPIIVDIERGVYSVAGFHHKDNFYYVPEWAMWFNARTRYQSFEAALLAAFDEQIEMEIQLQEYEKFVAARKIEAEQRAQEEARLVEQEQSPAEPLPDKELLCPLAIMVEGEQGQCVRNQCAWWVGKCAVRALAQITFDRAE